MKVKGDLQPGTFTIEKQPKRPHLVLVRFYENAVPFEEAINGITYSGWVYDEYHLGMLDVPDIYSYVAENYNTLIEQARIEDKGKNQIFYEV